MNPLVTRASSSRCSVASLALALFCACSDRKPEPLQKLAPAPLPTLAVRGTGAESADREAAYRVEPAPVFGEPVAKGEILFLEGATARWGAETVLTDRPDSSEKVAALLGKATQVPLVALGEIYLAQAAPALAALDDSRAVVRLRHPAEAVDYPVVLRDEEAFRAWLDEPKPGKIRIIQRADGFELQTNVGKLPGSDPNGPTVPVRGGQLDLATLRRGLLRLKERFTTAEDVCFVPSFGTPLRSVAAALSANYRAPGEPIFKSLCLVYPRPAKARSN